LLPLLKARYFTACSTAINVCDGIGCSRVSRRLFERAGAVKVASKKILGILTELEAKDEKLEFVVLGIGINVNQDVFPLEIDDIAISMKQVRILNYNLDDLLVSFLSIFEKWYKLYLNEGFSTIKKTWEDKSGVIGTQIVVKDGDQKIEGIVKSLKEDGALIIETADGNLETVYAGDVTCS